MGGIFVSYRREDSAGHAGRLFDRLKESFGKDRVFMDVAGIEPGVDFVEAIDSAVGSCDVLIVVIGKKWLDCTDAAGRRRLDDPKDFIRLETATALRRNIRVIPVLVQGATMPGAEKLPEDLQKLSRRQAIEISDTHWDSDVDQLIETLEKAVEKPGESIPPKDLSVRSKKRPRRMAVLLISIVGILVVIGGGIAYYVYQRTDQIPVPNVVGMTKGEALIKLRGAGFFSWEERSEASDELPGIVINQEPYPGTKISPKKVVSLVVTEGVKVPNVVGQTLGDATTSLKKAGLTIAGQDKKESSEVPPGTVLAQKPEAGTEVQSHSKVQLLVAVKPPETPKVERPRAVTVPNVVGMMGEGAADKLKGAGLRVGSMRTLTSDQRPGTVLDQKPKAGSQVEYQGLVDLMIAEGGRVVAASPPPVAPSRPPVVISVPNVVGVPVEKAKAMLAERGLAVSIRGRQTSEKPPGTVLDQNPRPGKEMEKGQRVELVIASEPTVANEQRRAMAKKLAQEWYAANLRKDVRGLVRIASLPFFFDNEVLSRFEDIETRYKNFFSKRASAAKTEDPGTWQLKEIKAQTIAEWKKEGLDVQRDRLLRSIKLNDDDFIIHIVVEIGSRREGVALYTRDVGNEIKLAGFWG